MKIDGSGSAFVGRYFDNVIVTRLRLSLALTLNKTIVLLCDNLYLRIVTQSWRVQAQVLDFPTTRLLWINTYLPTDPLTIDFDESELLGVLSEVESILDKTLFNDVIWNGDLNWDMSRRSGFSQIMKDFVEKLGLVSLWCSNPIDYTHVHTDGVSTSVLDHFLCNERRFH